MFRLHAARPPAGPPSDAAVQRFLETAERYGCWNATAEENAQVGLPLPLSPPCAHTVSTGAAKI
jgi:hypothetical protein